MAEFPSLGEQCDFENCNDLGEFYSVNMEYFIIFSSALY